MSRLVNMAEMTRKAYEGKYAVAHININNLEWTKAILTAAQELNAPVILGTSEGAVKYMGGMKTIVGMVNGMMEDLDITVPVTLHLDHGSYEGAKKAIEAGYTSIMYDGSHSPFEENYKNTKELVELAKAKGMSMEAEVGTLAGEEDGIIGDGDKADPEEAKKMAALGINVLAAGIGNIHGPYPAAWKSLDFDVLKEISAAAGMGIVLHGGSGIPEDQIAKAISLGVAKINVNTELQLVNAKATAEYVRAGGAEDMKVKGFDPRKLLKPGFDAMVEMSKQKITEFGSANKA
ncbi:MAG: class II fructose-1,6-bisphosphate aldolase [Mycoplasmatales bacterium]|nr:class II fructose-1,6-bisphosphate aldolase [Mycoplasmatales bacterium]